MRKLVRKLLLLVFSKEVGELNELVKTVQSDREKIFEKMKEVDRLLGSIEVSTDVHMNSNSWAVVSIQGEKSDYIKFIDMNERDVVDISRFLRQYERCGARVKVDTHPHQVSHIKNFIKF